MENHFTVLGRKIEKSPSTEFLGIKKLNFRCMYDKNISPVVILWLTISWLFFLEEIIVNSFPFAYIYGSINNITKLINLEIFKFLTRFMFPNC